MDEKTKIKLVRAGAIPISKQNPLDHTELGTPIAVKYTTNPVPPTYKGKLTKGNTATTEHGRDSGDVKKPKKRV